MLRFIDSFDHYPIADIYSKWTSGYAVGLGAITSSTFSSTFSIGATGRNSTNGITLKGLSYGVGIQLRKTLDNQSKWIMGAAISLSVVPTSTQLLFRFLDGTTTQCEININSAGKLVWTRNGTTLATGTTVLSATTFYYLECMITISSSISASTCVLQLNGVPEITLAASTNTQNTGNAYASTLELNSGVGFNCTFDDVYICDGTGSTNNSLLGDVRVECLFPNGAGTNTNWTPDTGSNYARVNEASEDGDTSYVYSSTASQIDTYALANLSSTPTTVYGAQVNIVNRKDDGGSRSIAPVLYSGGTSYAGTTVSCASTYAFLVQIWETNPATSTAWTGTSINALEAGVELIS